MSAPSTPLYSPPRFAEVDQTPSPALILDAAQVERNIDLMIRMAGRADRLRPHCKTHKMAAVARLELAAGVTRHKAATLAEVEMLAREGARDILLAYHLVGPAIGQALSLINAYPHLQLSLLVDDLDVAAVLSEAAKAKGRTFDLLADLDIGQHRTGVAPTKWRDFCQSVATLPGVRLKGLHLYDGHNQAPSRADRQAEVDRIWGDVAKLLSELSPSGIEIDEITAGGTGSFPCWASIDDPRIILSPGTVVFYDAGYGLKYADLEFRPAAWIFSRVVSRPAEGRITLDAGCKAVSGDPPLEKRAYLPELADAKIVAQNEEHLVIETSDAKKLAPGSVVWLIPGHVCPTVALHRSALVVRDGRIVDEWSVSARDRALSTDACPIKL